VEASTGQHESVRSSSTAARDETNKTGGSEYFWMWLGEIPAAKPDCRGGSWLIFSRLFAEKRGAGPRKDEHWQNVG
jgi:hypothetical protein